MKKTPKARRIELYLLPEERKEWERALALSKEKSMSAFLRALVAKEYRHALKAAATRGA